MRPLLTLSAITSLVLIFNATAYADSDRRGRSFAIEGIATITNNGSGMRINGVNMEIHRNADFDDISIDRANGKWLEVEGYMTQKRLVVTDVDYNRWRPTSPKRDDGRLEINLEGLVQADPIAMWGYRVTDGSLDGYEGYWLEIECDYNRHSNTISRCDIDD